MYTRCAELLQIIHNRYTQLLVTKLFTKPLNFTCDWQFPQDIIKLNSSMSKNLL